MRSSEALALPIAERDFNMDNEQLTRRAVEQAYSELRDDILANRDKTSSEASLSLRRHQFLLMGA